MEAGVILSTLAARAIWGRAATAAAKIRAAGRPRRPGWLNLTMRSRRICVLSDGVNGPVSGVAPGPDCLHGADGLQAFLGATTLLGMDTLAFLVDLGRFQWGQQAVVDVHRLEL